jgi:hypothetical protein
MKASELRIGNFVQDFDCEPHYFAIESIYKNEKGDYRCSYRNNSIDATVEDTSPIPLTEDWLLKFGFLPKNFGLKLPQGWYELKYLSNQHDEMITTWVSVLININSFSCVICDEYPDEIGANTKQSIRYIHQLQNLYFALTGEELTINGR